MWLPELLVSFGLFNLSMCPLWPQTPLTSFFPCVPPPPVMSFPMDTVDIGFRNQVDDIRSFLDSRHLDHYTVYNLSPKSYRTAKFHSRVRTLGSGILHWMGTYSRKFVCEILCIVVGLRAPINQGWVAHWWGHIIEWCRLDGQGASWRIVSDIFPVLVLENSMARPDRYMSTNGICFQCWDNQANTHTACTVDLVRLILGSSQHVPGFLPLVGTLHPCLHFIQKSFGVDGGNKGCYLWEVKEHVQGNSNSWIA